MIGEFSDQVNYRPFIFTCFNYLPVADALYLSMTEFLMLGMSLLTNILAPVKLQIFYLSLYVQLKFGIFTVVHVIIK